MDKEKKKLDKNKLIAGIVAAVGVAVIVISIVALFVINPSASSDNNTSDSQTTNQSSTNNTSSDDNKSDESNDSTKSDDNSTSNTTDNSNSTSTDNSSSSDSSSDSSNSNSSSNSSDSSSSNSDSGSSSNSGDYDEATVNVTVIIDSGGFGDSVYTCSVKLIEGFTVYNALGSTGLEINSRETQYGTYVTSINGLAEGSHGGESGWKYSVNGSEPNVACSKYVLKDGDVVKWKFVTSATESVD